MSLTQLFSSDIRNHLNRAVHFRESLSLNTNAMRLVNGAGDGLKGLIIERFNKHMVVYILDAGWHSHKDTISRFLCEHFDVEYLVFKNRAVSDTPAASAGMGEVLIDRRNSQTIVEENGLRFHVDLNAHLDAGLFLDMRQNRKRVASFARDKAVLNCFSYTCSFGVYCRKHGAARVINVDMSAKILIKGEENYRLNGLPADKSEFVRAHVIQYMERAAKHNNCFDIIILDPPSFSRYEGKVFSVKKDMPGMMEKALRILNDAGILFVSTNLSSISYHQLEEWAFVATKKLRREIVKVDRMGQDRDFRASGSTKESSLSALLLKTRVLPELHGRD
ncbi:MAG TPA: hypothetical protein DD723_05930 [Candidatus Omnitrophica bacterium]|nr:MAG: hypothetical protein A2Z81_06845 [Omnitrophica WOR_2 bacterium GWA2_45_18]OGX18307.1 MAG: hypothetical protein A2Y04_03565 [Omnitrophica WOR_2 bacterium GWC2_45_7]HBR15064.1 hypothetical protein [Candidatus Omnitrophota bacterium]